LWCGTRILRVIHGRDARALFYFISSLAVIKKIVRAESEVPEQLGFSLPAHDRASWRMLARVRRLGCLNSMILILARCWHSLAEKFLRG